MRKRVYAQRNGKASGILQGKSCGECGKRQNRMLLSYEYDYGSTTERLIKVQRHLEGMNQEEKIIIYPEITLPGYFATNAGKIRRSG